MLYNTHHNETESYTENGGSIALSMVTLLLIASFAFSIIEIFINIHNAVVNILFIGFFAVYAFFIPSIIEDYKRNHGINSSLYLDPSFIRKIFLLLMFNCALAFFAQETQNGLFVDFWLAVFGKKNELHFGLDTFYSYVFVRHDIWELIYINVVGLVYVVYLIDEHFNVNIFGRILAVIMYSWAFDFFHPHGRFMDIVMSGFGALISAFLVSLLFAGILSFVFSKSFVNLLGLYALHSEYDKQRERVDNLERARSNVGSDARMNRSLQNQLITEIDHEIKEAKRKLDSKEEEINDYKSNM